MTLAGEVMEFEVFGGYGGKMGAISEEHVEWAIVNRLKAMLDKPPKTKFNVTQSFALFSAVLLWTKNRSWVPDAAAEADRAAQEVRRQLGQSLIFDAPWSLSRARPSYPRRVVAGEATDRINADFEMHTAEQFFKWLRDALAHGDGRTIRPLHKPSRDHANELLAGFRVEFNTTKKSKSLLTLDLYDADMRRFGRLLADAFCKSLSGGDRYFEEDAATWVIEDAA